MQLARTLDWRGIRAASKRLLSATPPEVTLFWDGGCPLCRKEIAYYKWLDAEQRRVDWVNIDAQPEALAPHGVEVDAAMAKIHGLDKNGALVVGVPAFLAV